MVRENQDNWNLEPAAILARSDVARRDGASHATRICKAIRGLDADQILLTDFFALESTRAQEVAVSG